MPILVSPSAKKAWEKAVADRAIALQGTLFIIIIIII
jgi:hypothetical protein